MKARFAFLITGLLLASSMGANGADVLVPGCADPSHLEGEWRVAGGTPTNMRAQPNEHVINASNVSNLGEGWRVDLDTLSGVVGSGEVQNTPVVADGCVFITTSAGWVIALNADTGPASGAPVWATHLSGAPLQLRSGVITGSPTVVRGSDGTGTVYVGVNNPGEPYVAALDEATGKVLWQRAVDKKLTGAERQNTNSGIAAAPVYFDGMVFQGFYGTENDPDPRGGFAVLDAGHFCDPASFVQDAINVCTPDGAQLGATGGTILAKRYTISDTEWAKGYRGASIWCTAAYDPETKSLYACGGNPASKKLEARYSNALLKIDGNRNSATFGDIVDAFKGNPDNYYPGLERQPACDELGEEIAPIWSAPCLQLDLDFGSSPSVFKDEEGNTLVGDLQKSGVYWAVYADNMEHNWSTIVGTPGPTWNASSPAYDFVAGTGTDPVATADKVYVAGTAPATMWALTGYEGRYRWASPIGQPLQFQPVSTANGVVYTVDAASIVHAFDAATGQPLLRLPLLDDADQPIVSSSSQGVSIARNTVYVASGSYIVALRG